MCAQCESFHDSVRLGDAHAYAAALARAQRATDAGDLEAVETSTAAGHARHVFACTLCAQLFILEVGGCHVLGDQWRPLHGN